MTPEQQKQFLRQTFTLKGRIFHPNLIVPVPKDKDKPDSPLKFNVMFAFKAEDNTAVLKQLADFLNIAKQEFHPSIPMQFFSNPLKKFETYMRRDGKPNAEYLKGSYWVNASSGKDYPPQVVDANRQPLINPAEIYSGRNAVVNIGFYSFTGQQNGLSTNINAVMLLDGGEKIASAGGSVNIDQIFGSFQADMGMTPTTVTQDVAPAWPPQNTNANTGGFV
jgi:hypothetical protein